MNNSPVAHNIPIGELISVLTDMMLRGNRYVDVTVDEDFMLRLKGFKRISEQKKGSKRDIDGKLPPLPGDIELMDLI